MPISASASADSQKIVSLYADGHKQLFATQDDTVEQVLEHAGIKLSQGDLVVPSASTKLPAGTFNINVYRAQPVVVIDGNKKYYVRSAYQSPRLLAQAAGLTVYPEDRFATGVVSTADVVKYGAVGEEVTVQPAKPITVQVDGTTRNIRTQATTIGQALKGAGISLGPKDTVSAPLTSPVVSGLNITVTRVSQAVVTLTQSLPFSTTTVTDPNLLKGQSQVTKAGVDGQKTVTYLIHYTNGVETSRQALQLVSETPPVAQVLDVGTKVIFEGSVEYWRPLVEQAAQQWGLDPNMMLRIMQCESNGHAGDVNPGPVYQPGYGFERAEGLFQYLPSTWVDSGGTMSNIFDGATQIEITAKVMAQDGTSAWACR